MELNRRKFGLLAGASVAAVKFANANAQTVDASALSSTLTPLGAERAGNADGSIPAWTGGANEIPSGLAFNDYFPDPFPDEQPIVVINSSNMAEHADRLTDGVKAMMTKYGLQIKVFPTHRTACAPQYVYDNTAKNVSTAKLTPPAGRFGFNGAYGGVPFPIIDTANPAVAGAQIVWNQGNSFRGFAQSAGISAWTVNSGQVAVSYTGNCKFQFPFYDPNGSLASSANLEGLEYDYFTGPENLLGQVVLVHAYNDPGIQQTQVWELENGQGRVRRAPELSFDTPSSQLNGIANYDEVFGFTGSLERYNWNLLEKKEMYIPYNNNKLFGAKAEDAHLAHFLDPNLVRWELHRVWVVEATLAPGERNVLARRRLYIDEDTWLTGVVDAWDGAGNLYKVNLTYNYCRPDLPGTIYGNNTVHNLQTDDYVSVAGPWDQATRSTLLFVPGGFSKDTFDPSIMAASAQF